MYVRNRAHQHSIVVRTCEDCNSWSNHMLEIPTGGLLEDLYHSSHIILSPAAQELIAAYMTRHVLMTNLWSLLSPDTVLTSEIYRRFRQTMKPPEYTRVWLGTVKDADPQREQAVMLAIPETRPLTGNPKCALPRGSSCQVFRFFELLVVWERVPHGDDRSAGERLIRRTEAAGLITRIWPPQRGDLAWPPEAVFDTTTQGRWAKRFGTIL